jgi:caa(3)-type oxidase subunit IV
MAPIFTPRSNFVARAVEDGPFAGIPGTKALLVALFFMHLRYREPAMRVFALAGLFSLVILFTLTLSDYLTRA